jgi:hypothetical protein
MRIPLLIILAVVVVGAAGVLAVLNNSCKIGRHAWCAPISSVRHHVKTEHG